MATITRYSIEDIEKLEYTFTLPDAIINIINDLSELVSAPEYNKTPQFSNERYKKKKKQFDWAIQSFEKTIIKKNEGIKKEIDNIRKLLNKLTENTSVSICESILVKMNELVDEYSDEEMIEVGNAIFNIIINNMMYSHIYALLYTKIIHFTFIKDTIMEQFSHCLDIYKMDIPTQKLSYDDLCLHNKKLDQNKATILLFINLMKHDIIQKGEIVKIILEVQNMILDLSNQNDKKQLVDELSNLIFVLVKNTYNFIDIPDKLEEIVNNVQYIANMKVKNRPSITHKSIFKHMDLLDEIKVLEP